jgi:quercetin dioxygenase-like cupin family protein
MSQIFPKPITSLPEAEVPIKGIIAFLSQGLNHQIVFMQFSEDVDVPEHFHESQWGIVLEGRIELTIDGIKNVYVKGERFFIAKNIKHSAKIYAGYASMEFFAQSDRYKVKNK